MRCTKPKFVALLRGRPSDRRVRVRPHTGMRGRVPGAWTRACACAGTGGRRSAWASAGRGRHRRARAGAQAGAYAGAGALARAGERESGRICLRACECHSTAHLSSLWHAGYKAIA